METLQNIEENSKYFFHQILMDLYDRISTEVTEITYIDQDLGQLGQTGDNEKPPLSYPAILIDFPDSEYSDIAGGGQIGEVPISFQLIFDTYSQTWHKSPKNVIIKGLDYLKIEQKIHKCLQSWHLDYFSPLSRKSVKSQNNNDIGLRVRQSIYTTQYEDYTPIEEDIKEVTFSFSGSLKKE
ncbi:hypothetical protein SAMN05421786_11528 [Chryseobacterium ureilyticum]|uniref:Uncharacterized protein n=1 Tax=Chryseobacterium ureilyticum TaxID=373668 RepID=A0A1N7QRR3_9FLAO|nr:hypothetical protein [Chryseobacterium ureilyticum]SIT25563.1 hypothetical protein SAMN05421786_11528 [Chryseobacterium ureilyticum]